jgi:hypothetical protein
MPNPKLFIGSSKRNIEVARLIANKLESDGCADVTIWDEGVFTLNEGVLDRLLAVVSEYDFAVLVWAADDVTESKGESKASPRDNVIFECGLFMGAVGKGRVFIVCDQSAALKIPSDFAGVTLAYYDGSKIPGDDAEAAVRMACYRIATEIRKPRYPEIIGEWRSRYALTGEPGHGEMIEDTEIKAARGGISITSKQSSDGDPYGAYGRIYYQNQIMGEWRSKAGNGVGRGLFLLTINPKGTVMYGYCTALDEAGATAYATWVLVKKGGLKDSKMTELMRWGEKMLGDLTIAPVWEPDNTASASHSEAADPQMRFLRTSDRHQ